MLLEKKYSVRIGTYEQRNRLYKIGLEGAIGDIVSATSFQLLAIKSTIQMDCICDECGAEFKLSAGRILSRKMGYKYCAKCALSVTSSLIANSESVKKIFKSRMSAIHSGKPKTQEHKDNISKSKNSEKYKTISRENLPPPQIGKNNPAWKEKCGFELFKYYCNYYKNIEIKNNGWKHSRQFYIVYKMDLHTAYKIGIDPKLVGSRILQIPAETAKGIFAFKNNMFPKLPKRPKARLDREYKEFKRYREAVSRLSQKVYLKNINIINPHNLTRGKQKIGIDTYHLDHIIPINLCWKHNISVEVCSDINNLRLIHWRENISKNGRLLDEHQYLLEELITRSNNQNG